MNEVTKCDLKSEDIIRLALEHFGAVLKPSDLEVRLAVLVAAEKDKEIERLLEDTKRLDWCISVLHSKGEKDSYLVTDAGCGCCGAGRYFDCNISGRDAIDKAMQERS